MNPNDICICLQHSPKYFYAKFLNSVTSPCLLTNNYGTRTIIEDYLTLLSFLWGQDYSLMGNCACCFWGQISQHASTLACI